jgi:glutamate formiminotransferase
LGSGSGDIVIAIPNFAVERAGVPPLVNSQISNHYDGDHSRLVVTLAARPKALLKSIDVLVAWVVDEVDIRTHTGVHPRFGVLDVVPLVRYRAQEHVVRRLADDLVRLFERAGLPCHTYGRANPDGRSLPELRRLLRATPHRSHPTAGVVCLGIRDPLVAFNIDFRGGLKAVREVARFVRAPEVRALGFELKSRGLVQVSMNLIEPERVGPKEAFDRALVLARERDLELVDCEVVGLVPHPILEQLEGLPLRAPVRSIEQALEEKGLA